MKGLTVARASAQSVLGILYAKDFPTLHDAINRAVALSSTSRFYAVQLPAFEDVVLTEPLDLSGSSGAGTGFGLIGHPSGSRIRGAFADFLVKKSNAGLVNGPSFIRDIFFSNTHGSALGCVQVRGLVGLGVSGCSFESQGIDLDLSPDPDNAPVFASHVDTCRFLGNGTNTGIGIQTHGHADITDCDIVAKGEGVRACGVSVSITGGRMEVNLTAMRLGVDQAGATSGLSRSFIGGMSMEANDVGIDLVSVNTSVIAGVGLQGSTNSPAHLSKYGLIVRSFQGSVMEGADFSGNFSGAAIQLLDARATFVNVTGNNVYPNRPSWDIRTDVSAGTFINCNPILPGANIATSLQSLAVPSLAGIDLVNGVQKGLNLRGLNVTVPSGSSSINVAFPVTRSAGAADINSLTAASGGSLATGTYYYVATVKNALGESSYGSEHTVTLSGSNHTVNVAFFGMSGTPFRRRVYRGTASGVYDGYYELAANSNATFSDTGATLDGFSGPPSGVAAPSGAEPDANYSVTATPAWDAGGCWITSKATTGFTINFHTAPGSDSTVDWQMIR